MSPAGAPSTSERRWPAAVILCGFAAIVLYLLHEVLVAGNERLPGRDSVNLYVWEVYTRSVLAASRLPFWNPFHFAGSPHLADPQTTVFYPPAVMLRWLSPPQLFFAWMAALHIWLAGAGGLFLGRVVGLGWGAAAAAALAVMLGGSAGPWLHNGHLLPLYCMAWLPWAMALAILSARRATVWPHPALVLVMVLQFLAGYLQMSIYFAASICLYFVFSAAWPEHSRERTVRWRALAQLAVLGVLALGLSAFQLFPTARLVFESSRIQGMPYAEAIEDAWTFRSPARLFFPFYGVPADTPFRYMPDLGAYVGWMLTALVPMAFLDRGRRRIAVMFGVLAVVAIALATADLPFYRLHHELFPGFRRPGRVLFLATLSLAMLGGLGLERFLALANARNRRPLLAGLAVGAAAIAGAVFVVFSEGGLGSSRPAPAWPWLPFIVVAGLAVAGVLAARNRMWAAATAAVALVSIDVVAFTADVVSTVPVESPATITRWMGPAVAGRAISTCENRIGSGELLRHGQPGLGGMAGIHLGHYVDWAHIARYGDAPPRDGRFRGVDSEGPFLERRDLADVANVSTFVSCRPLDAPSLTLVSMVDGIYVYRNELAWPRAVWTCGGRRITAAEATTEILQGRYRDGHLRSRVSINIRWAPEVGDDLRRGAEERHRLGDGEPLGDRTWRYTVADPTPAHMLAIIGDAAVEDTHGVDRFTGAVTQPSAAVAVAGPEGVLIGTAPCDARGTVDVIVQDQPDGLLVADVEAPAPGLVFLSEPFYAERRAFVDGEPVTPLRANLAFTAVPVQAGRHRLELRYVPESFHRGLGASGLTLAGWGGLVFLTRRGWRSTLV